MFKIKPKSLILYSTLFLFIASFIFAMVANIVIAVGYDRYLYHDIEQVPRKDVALVLGTSRLVSGRPNLYYTTRIRAAADLYHAGIVRKILVSGDNAQKEYNEPRDMKKDLMALGVGEEDIYRDYAGFRTLDSIIRANKVFLLKEFIIVSQPFQCERALFIARNRDISAIAFASPDIRHPGRARILLREFFARVKAGIDIWLIDKSPMYLGERITII